MKNIIILFFTVVTLSISGCVTPPVYNYGYRVNDQQPDFRVVDKRPGFEKESEWLSLIITNDLYGIYRVGDTQVVPDRMVYLADQLHMKTSNQLTGKSVHVSRFEILNNKQEALKNGSSAVFGGAILAAISTLSAGELEAFIDLTLEIRIDNKDLQSHIVQAYYYDAAEGISNEKLAETIKSTMDQAIDEVLSQIYPDPASTTTKIEQTTAKLLTGTTFVNHHEKKQSTVLAGSSVTLLVRHGTSPRSHTDRDKLTTKLADTIQHEFEMKVSNTAIINTVTNFSQTEIMLKETEKGKKSAQQCRRHDADFIVAVILEDWEQSMHGGADHTREMSLIIYDCIEHKLSREIFIPKGAVDGEYSREKSTRKEFLKFLDDYLRGYL